MTTPSGANTSFEAFFEAWLVRQEHYLDELLSAQQSSDEAQDDDLKDLVYRVLLHYQQYYDEKSRIAQRDVLQVFSPTWFTSLERTLLWIAGYKPGLAFRLLTDSVPDLSDGQRTRVTRIMDETKAEERLLNDKLAKIHESVAAPPLVEVARHCGRLVNGEISTAEEDSRIKTLKSALESVLASANLLRTTLVLKLLEVLSAAQSVKFFAAVAQFQLKMRTWGLQSDAEKQQESSVPRGVGGGGGPIGRSKG